MARNSCMATHKQLPEEGFEKAAHHIVQSLPLSTPHLLEAAHNILRLIKKSMWMIVDGVDEAIND